MLAADTDRNSPFVMAASLRDTRRGVLAGLALSLLLHLLLGLLWLDLTPMNLADAGTDLVAIELVNEPPPIPTPPPPPAPPPPQPPPAPEPPPPPPPPAAPAPPPPPPPAAAAAPPLPPPSVVQRETARNAERSSSPNQAPVRPPTGGTLAPPPTQAAPATQPASRDGLLAPAPPRPRDEPRGLSAIRGPVQPPSGGPPGESLTQSEIDHLLAQVFAVWIFDFRNPRFRDLTIVGAFELKPDGTLSAPFGAYDPWRPDRMIADYETLLARPDLREQRTVMESFLGAMRQAQPFARQPDAPPLTAPKILRFSFRLGDLMPP
jgi:hypothetical protein